MSDLLDRDAAIRALLEQSKRDYLDSITAIQADCDQMVDKSDKTWDFRQGHIRGLRSAVASFDYLLKALPLAAPATESLSPLTNEEARLEGASGKPEPAVAGLPLRETPYVSAASAAPVAPPRLACCEPAPDRSGRACDKPKGHDGEHWTYGGNEKTWPAAAPVAPTAPRWTAETVRQVARYPSHYLGAVTPMLDEFAARLDAEAQPSTSAVDKAMLRYWKKCAGLAAWRPIADLVQTRQNEEILVGWEDVMEMMCIGEAITQRDERANPPLWFRPLPPLPAPPPDDQQA